MQEEGDKKWDEECKRTRRKRHSCEGAQQQLQGDPDGPAECQVGAVLETSSSSLKYSEEIQKEEGEDGILWVWESHFGDEDFS